MANNIVSRFDSLCTRYLSGKMWNLPAELVEPDAMSAAKQYFYHNVNDPLNPLLEFNPGIAPAVVSSIIPKTVSLQALVGVIGDDDYPESSTTIHIIGNDYTGGDNNDQSFTIIGEQFEIIEDTTGILLIGFNMTPFNTAFGITMLSRNSHGILFIQESNVNTSLVELPVSVSMGLSSAFIGSIDSESYTAGNIIKSFKIVI